jgi:hypothetical protein
VAPLQRDHKALSFLWLSRYVRAAVGFAHVFSVAMDLAACRSSRFTH